MVTNKTSKSRKLRGVRQHGYGKTHRGAGNRGGRGNAGTGKKADQKKSTTWNNKKYFGKSGFVRLRVKKDIVSININLINEKFDYFIKKGFAKENKEVIEIDLKKAGYDKLLGTGTPIQKFSIKVSSASKKALEKIKNAGGEVITEV